MKIRGWREDLGWLLRTRSKGKGEGKRKFATYAEAREAAREAEQSGSFKEIWITENEMTVCAFRDLQPRAKIKPKFSEDNLHVIGDET